MAKKEVKTRNLTRQELLEKERELLGFNLTSIIGENKLKIETYGYKGIRTINDILLAQEEAKNLKIAAIVTNIEFRTSKAGNYFYWIHITDDFTTTKMYCNDNTFKELQYDLIKGRCVLFNVNIRNDFVTFDKCKLIENIPFKQGYILSIHLPYGQWSDMFTRFIADELDRTIRRGTVEVYLRKYPLGLYIDPSYELMQRIEKIFGVKCSLEVYEDYIWGDSNKLIKELEDIGYI